MCNVAVTVFGSKHTKIRSSLQNFDALFEAVFEISKPSCNLSLKFDAVNEMVFEILPDFLRIKVIFHKRQNNSIFKKLTKTRRRFIWFEMSLIFEVFSNLFVESQQNLLITFAQYCI